MYSAMDDRILSQANREYLESRILSLPPTEIVQMLYRVAIDNLNAAIGFLSTGDAFARARAVTKAEEAVDELILSLDHSVGASFTKSLADLYAYCLRQIVAGHARQSEQAFRDALTILTSLADTWTKVRENLAAQNAVDEAAVQEVERASTPDSPYAACPVSRGSRDWSA
jgi:flagellar biosynthetic protein FliS